MTENSNNHNLITSSHDVAITSIRRQAEALLTMAEHLEKDPQFKRAIEIISDNRNTPRRVVVTGVGKSGHVGRKIAATLASTGTPSYFVHSTEAFHGDLGMIRTDDVILMVSNSGETEEVTKLIPIFKRWGNKMISITGNPLSKMATESHAVILTKIPSEVCPNKLAPTTSTTAALVAGDSIACALIHLNRFKDVDFAEYHPGGSLGKMLLTTVKDHMVPIENLPFVSETDTSLSAVFEMTNKGHSLCVVKTEDNKITGILTDGDIRRSKLSGVDILSSRVADVMTPTAKLYKIDQSTKLQAAQKTMNEVVVKQLVVTKGGVIVGIICR